MLWDLKLEDELMNYRKSIAKILSIRVSDVFVTCDCPRSEEYSGSMGGVYFRTSVKLPDNKYEVALCKFEFQTFPGNPIIAVSVHTEVNENFRNKGIARTMQEIKTTILKKNNIKLVLCTVNGKNAPQLRVLEASGWVDSGVKYISQWVPIKLMAKEIQ